MKRFFFVTVFMILAIGVGWRYAPSAARERLLSFVGAPNNVDPGRVAQSIREKIMPENPVARRAALAGALKEKIREIRENAAVAVKKDQHGAPAGAPETAVLSVKRAAENAVQLVDQLAQASANTSVSGRVIQRIVDRILPTKECKE